MQKTNNNNNVLLKIHIKHKKCTESLLNGDYSVKLSDPRCRKIDSKEASSLSQESLLTSTSLGASCALGRLRQRVLCFLRDSAFSVFCAIAAHGEKIRKQSASLALDGCVLRLRLC